MVDSKKEKPRNDAPEIEMVKSVPGQLLSKQFQILTTTNHPSLDEYLLDKFNTSKENTQDNDSIKSCLFPDNLMNTNPNQPNNNEAMSR